MKNLEVCVQITIKPTEAGIDAERVANRVEGGRFRLVLEEGSLFAIDALEAGVLETGYATMRDALAGALEEASREKATAVCGEKGGPVEWSGTRVTTGSMGR